MKVKVVIVVERDRHETPLVEEIACLERQNMLPENTGLSLAEGKEILARTQETMVTQQALDYISKHEHCPFCQLKYGKKGTHNIVFRTLFGKINISSPRFYSCSCQPRGTKSFSPLAEGMPERKAPELVYLQSKWSSLMSYGVTVNLLNEVLPLKTSITTVIRNTHHTAERLEDELGEEQHMYIDGCELEWEQLPDPDPPLTVGIDGGYIHGRDETDRKAGCFEVIVGKSMPVDGPSKRFGFVNDYDKKSKRRLFEVLTDQALQMNQTITFLSDGGETVRNLQLYMSPNAEHILDWFHVTMRLTVMKQMAKGVTVKNGFTDIEKNLESVKWYLWHGNVYMALQQLDRIEMDMEVMEAEDPENKKNAKLLKAVSEFSGYICNNSAFIPNYGDRYHYGETISTAFVESTVNEVISKRMVKKQQMRWTKEGAHLLLQVRTKALNNELRDKFQKWYPGMVQAEADDYNDHKNILINAETN